MFDNIEEIDSAARQHYSSLGIHPTDPTRAARIHRAATAVAAYAKASGGGSLDEIFTDLIADLGHLAQVSAGEDGSTLDFDDAIRVGLNHYNHERNENV